LEKKKKKKRTKMEGNNCCNCNKISEDYNYCNGCEMFCCDTCAIIHVDLELWFCCQEHKHKYIQEYQLEDNSFDKGKEKEYTLLEELDPKYRDVALKMDSYQQNKNPPRLMSKIFNMKDSNERYQYILNLRKENKDNLLNILNEEKNPMNQRSFFLALDPDSRLEFVLAMEMYGHLHYFLKGCTETEMIELIEAFPHNYCDNYLRKRAKEMFGADFIC
jgi:hypothetical protein